MMHGTTNIKVFSCSEHPDRLWGPSSFLFNGYRGCFSRDKL